MAGIAVVHDLSRVFKLLGRWSKRARALPRRQELRARGKVAIILAGGAKVRVTRKMQGFLAKKYGIKPPPIGKMLVIPPRPVGVTRKTSRQMAFAMAEHVATGKPIKGKQIMIEGVGRQFDAGGIPKWKKSRDWRGKPGWKARRPTGGGSRGRAFKGWRQGRYVAK